MKATDIAVPRIDEVVVVYHTEGGVPYIDLVTRSRKDAADQYNRLVLVAGEYLVASQAETWRKQNPEFTSAIKEIDGKLVLASTSDFDVFIDVVSISG